ncbi:MAG TPA: AMP-binding protein [Candidatus Aveggerthella excrementigallinarum]|nr:AMP-binding protein [Candidatus Aveggerthella excrementigallinarum]
MTADIEGKTIGGLFREVAQARDDAVFISFEGSHFSYRSFLQRVDELAKGLMACGVKKGDRVALWAGNHPDWIACYLATVSIGGVLVTVNTRFHADELCFELDQCQASLVVMEGRFLKQGLLDRALDVMPELAMQPFGEVRSERLPAVKGVVTFEPHELPGIISLDEMIERGRAIDDEAYAAAREAVGPDDTAIMIYTSGTTGTPKGVEQQHVCLLNRMQRFAAWNGMNEDDSTFFALPLFHSFGVVVTVLGVLVTGSKLCLMEKFKAREALETIDRERCTVIHGVPSSFFMMLEDPEFDRFDLSCGRTGVLGGALCPPDLAQRIVDNIAPHISEAWGQTETCGMVTGNAPSDTPEQIANTVGRVIPGSEVFVLDVNTGMPVGVGEQGEVTVKSPYNMKGYYRMEEETKQAFDPQYGLRTGDLGYFREDGCLVINGRIRDMFIVGGVNAYPREIENHIRLLEGVSDVQVVGVPDDRLGEVACAYVIKKAGATLSEQDVIDHCKELANYKIPRHVRFVEEFPMTANGKVKKYVLQRMFADEVGAEVAATVPYAEER